MFAAEVTLGESLMDGNPAIILDYRIDDTVTGVSPLAIRQIRDEIRQVHTKKGASPLYLGRALLRRYGPKRDWENRQSYRNFSVYFILDASEAAQRKKPQWIEDA